MESNRSTENQHSFTSAFKFPSKTKIILFLIILALGSYLQSLYIVSDFLFVLNEHQAVILSIYHDSYISLIFNYFLDIGLSAVFFFGICFILFHQLVKPKNFFWKVIRCCLTKLCSKGVWLTWVLGALFTGALLIASFKGQADYLQVVAVFLMSVIMLFVTVTLEPFTDLNFGSQRIKDLNAWAIRNNIKAGVSFVLLGGGILLFKNEFDPLRNFFIMLDVATYIYPELFRS